METSRAGQPGAPRIVAHQGLNTQGSSTGGYPNSMDAFRRACDIHVDALETDIHRTRDGVLVLYHDDNLDGTNTPITDVDYAELPKLPNGECIPRMSELAALSKERGIPVDFEIKVPGYERQIIDELHEQLTDDQFEIISFRDQAIAAVEQIDPGVRTGVLGPTLDGRIRDGRWFPAIMRASDFFHWRPSLDRMAKLGADFVSINEKAATAGYLADAKRRGIHLDVWTVDDESRMRQLIDQGVAGIVTNDSDVAQRLRDSMPG
jgi:glycerophosphoryl diester phosphodiesterase